MKRAGFRKIDNDLFHSIIAANLSGSEYKILLTIIDRTLGFQRESQKISLSEFQAMTRLSRQGVCNALRQATNKGIVATQKSRGKKTVYALVQDYDRWTTSQSEFTSELVNKSLPNQSTEVYQTSQVPVSSSHHIKETLKETLKERGTSKEKVTSNIITSGVREDAHPTTPTLIRKEIQTGTREIEPTIGGATYREKIAVYLGAHGPAAIKTIAQATGIDANSVNVTLHNGKGKRFLHLAEQRAWGVTGKDTPLAATEVKPSKDTPLTDTERVPADDNGDKIGPSNRERIIAYLDTHGPSPIKDLVRELGLTTKQVTRVLDRYRDKYFRHYKESHLWGNTSELSPKRDIKPVKVLRGRPIIFETIDLINRKGTA